MTPEHDAGQQAAATWECPGCGTPYPQAHPDLITGHVRDCDYVDGTGQAYDVTLTWSVIRQHAATVRSSDLAAATGGRPFDRLAGVILDPDDDDPDAGLPDYLDELAAGAGSDRGSGDWEISQIYDARRDQPRTP